MCGVLTRNKPSFVVNSRKNEGLTKTNVTKDDRKKDIHKETGIFIFGLLHDSVSSLDFTASNDRKTDDRLIGKDLEGSGRSLI